MVLGVAVTAAGPVAAREGGVWSVGLEAQPADNAVAQASSDNSDATAQPSSLTFTGGDWQLAPIVLGSVVKLPRHSGESRNPRVSLCKSSWGIEPSWIPAFAGMTEIKLSHGWQLNLTTPPGRVLKSEA